MCGIVGAFPLNKKGLEIDGQLRKLLTLYLHNEILLETISRGRDATGVAISFESLEEGKPPFWCVLKQPVDVVDFLSNNGTQARYNGQDKDANMERMMDVACLFDGKFNHILGHTRAKTLGSEYKPLNNHPIMVGNIIGVHNGGVANYKQIYKKHPKMTQQGDVDSEVIFQLLAEIGNDRELNAGDIKYVTERIEGPHAVLAYNRLHPGKILFFRNQPRPLELAYIPELGLAMLHSESKFMNTAMHTYNRARLTTNRNLPALSLKYVNISPNEGGVIDIHAEYEEAKLNKIGDLFPIIESGKLLDAYTVGFDVPAKNSAIANYKNAEIWNKGSSKTNDTNSFKSTEAKAPLANTSQKISNASLIDISDYIEEVAPKEAVKESTGQFSLPASAIMDDTSDSVMEVNGTGDLLEDLEDGPYTQEELRILGAEWALSEEAREDKTLYINRHEGKFAEAFSLKGLKEEECAELVHQIFPEMCSEGYAVGFRHGHEEGQLANEAADENTEKREADLIHQVAALTKELAASKSRADTLSQDIQKEKAKQAKAASYIANMKAIIIAYSIVIPETMGVGKYGDETITWFNRDVEKFVLSHESFDKANPEAVLNLISPQDIDTIIKLRTDYNKKGMVEIAKDVANNQPAVNKQKA